MTPQTPVIPLDKNSYKHIFDQYVNEASFLWILRSISLNEPHNTVDEIQVLEKRIDAQLEGLMTSIDMGWKACDEALEIQEPGEVFTAVVIAMKSHDVDKVKIAIHAGLNSSAAQPGLISAMGWIDEGLAFTWINHFLKDKNLQHKYIGIAACSVCRLDPGTLLTTIFNSNECRHDIKLYSRALRLVGEIKRFDCKNFLEVATNHKNKHIKFWSNWALIMLGDVSHIENMRYFVFNVNEYQNKAIQIVFRVLSIEEARKWTSELSKDSIQLRAAIKSIGVLGDPYAITWLINKMKDTLYAKLAAESFSYITGIKLEDLNLSIKTPDSYPVIPNDEMYDDIIGLDEDENLPFPDAGKVSILWNKIFKEYISGQRYFLGENINIETLNKTINISTQRQRIAAALELALLQPEVVLINIKAKTQAE